MLIVCGRNEYKQLGENANSIDVDGSPIIFPPCKSHLDISTLLSYSIYSSHLVWITKDQKAFAIGFNSVNKICSTLPSGKIDKDTEIKFLDTKGRQCNFLSAVCGTYYTLYLISPQYDNKSPQLALVYQGENNGRPLFLNIGNSHPVELFGGRLNAAAIDSKGSILIITDIVFKSPLSPIKPSCLPNNERAICLGCCDDFIIALSSSGKVYECDISNKSNISTFSEVTELKNINCIHVSGAFTHCFVVTKDGHVYGRGSNENGKLGLGQSVKKVDKFTEISSLNDKKIIQASAGRFHSLFLCNEGKIYGCGLNNAGSLMLKSGNSINVTFLPIETSITSGATYCFAGNCLSTVIIGPDIPPNLPNYTIKEKPIQSSPIKQKSEINVNELVRSIQLKDQEISLLKKENEMYKKTENEINEMKKSIQSKNKEIEHLKKSNEIQKKKIDELQLKLKEKSEDIKPSHPKKLDIIDINDIDKIKKITKIGRGAMAKVYKVCKEQIYAMKVINLEICRDENDDEESHQNLDFKKMKKFFQEYEILIQLNHPNIIQTYGFCFGDENNKPFILLEYCPYNLSKIVKTLEKEEQISIIMEICDAMRYVHQAGIIHRDLKLENILLDNEKHVRISDFGISTLIKLESESMGRTQMTGTLRFMAPELILEKTDYDEKVDVYSFGIVVYLILTKGEYPKISIGDTANGKMAALPSTISQFSQDLIKKCWSFEAKNRPSFNEIYQLIQSNKNKIIHNLN